jgi:glutamine amidotransferase-like uncharacterized protein
MALIRAKFGSATAIVLLLTALCACGGGEAGHALPGPEAADVAIYQDDGCWPSSVVALEKMFQWMGYRTTRVNADEVNRLGLENYRIFCIPGGDMYKYSQSFTTQGKNKIRAFIQGGRGYIGVCGGAYFAASRVTWRGNPLPIVPLGLYDGSAEGPIDAIVAYPDSGMCRIRMVNRDHPITASLPDSAWILYYWGPALRPDPLAPVAVLGKYSAVEEPAILAFSYGQGRVFLIGTHPEIEENSDRDGVTFTEEMDDRGSDWDLMKNAAAWCAKRP